ncbi:MAG: alpha/beta hydrolase [Pseudomonadota bacterium]
MAWLAALAGCVERQFFYPDRTAYTTPAQFGLKALDVTIPGPEGSQLHGWWLPAVGPALGTVLHLHGNAANISNHLPLVAWVPHAGFNLLTFDYRGFGKSDGEPSLDGVVADGLAALAWLKRQPGVDAHKLVVLGQSLGGATAVRVVAADPAGVKLLVLDCPFSSYRGIARDAVRGSWLGWVAPAALRLLPGHDKDPVTVIRRLPVPLFVLHSADDAVVPIAHGKALYAAAPEPKQWLEVQQTQHVDGLTHESIRQRVIAAMQSALQAR